MLKQPTFELVRNNNILEFKYSVNQENTGKGRIKEETKLIKMPKYMICFETIGNVKISEIKEEIRVCKDSEQSNTFSKTYSVSFHDVINSISFCQVISLIQSNVPTKIPASEAKYWVNYWVKDKNHFMKIFLCLSNLPLLQDIHKLIFHIFSLMVTIENILVISE